ncbi:MAG: DUF2953 domain-containing protein [Vallitalea sp.]|jgi:hypothetical protein|nr:DUF2953 domain-containing protein [Vallitalea sp.]
MLAIILGILKVILYIILGIIAIILLLLCVILFVPIKYRVYGEKYDIIKLDVRINWLFHIFSFTYHLEDTTVTSIKIFGKNILGEKKRHKEKRSKHKKTKKNKEDNVDEKQLVKDDENTISEVELDSSNQYNKDIDSSIPLETNQNIKDNKIKNTKIKVKKNKKKNKEKNKAKNKTSGNNKWKDIFIKIKDFIKNEDNKAVIKMLKDKILKIIKHILPKKFKADIVIGTGDPASTGYVVGAVSILYTVTGDKLKVIPNFNEKIIQGSLNAKGKIYLIVLLKNTLSIILDKRVRKIYKTYKA